MHKNALTRGAKSFSSRVAGRTSLFCVIHGLATRHALDETSALCGGGRFSITRRGLLTQLTSITTGGRGEIIARSRCTGKMKNGSAPPARPLILRRKLSRHSRLGNKESNHGQAAFVIIFAHTLGWNAKKCLVHTPLHMTQLQMVSVGAALIVALRRPGVSAPFAAS